jgi:cytochrome d ubiquinol oxidase subunit II
VSDADLVAAVLWIAVTLYAVLAGADFGAGLWYLAAGGGDSGRSARALVERSLAPVWEANHVWLIFSLVVLWTAFGDAFAAVMSTLFVPLSLAALGIVLRGSGFAFRKLARRLAERQSYDALFSLSSVLTPFFMGTVVGAVASGRVPADGNGDRLTSWTGPTSFVVGALFVATCGFVAAVFLVHDARRSGDEALVEWFRVRALAAGVVAGLLAAAGLVVLRGDARPIFDGLTSEGLPFVIASGLCGAGALVALGRRAPRGNRALAVGAVATVVWGWGAAQYPDLLPGTLTLSQAAAPHATLVALLVVFGAALLLVVPAIGLLFALHQRSMLEEGRRPPGGAG